VATICKTDELESSALLASVSTLSAISRNDAVD